jgi:hypothetical protein
MSLESFAGMVPHLSAIDLAVGLVNAVSVHHDSDVVIIAGLLN